MYAIRSYYARMKELKNRKARFRTVIAVVIDGKKTLMDGVVEGEILTEKHGTDGFGYDPIFQPIGWTKTFAEMDLATKNQISHRSRAVQKLVTFLNR